MTDSKAIRSFTDHETVFKERTGNDFVFFYEKYYPKLIYYTQKMCKDLQKAEDVATESFMTAFEKIEKYEREKAQFSTWLFTIARNIMLQDIKASKKTVSIDVNLDQDGTTLKDFIPEQEDTSYLNDITLKKSDIILNYMSGLKEPYKSVIEMREIKKMSYKDIACELGYDVKIDLNVLEDGVFELPIELSKVFSITKDGEEYPDYELMISSKGPFFTDIDIKSGDYVLNGRTPKNLSTVKSQIKNGRAILISKSQKEFDLLDEMYL